MLLPELEHYLDFPSQIKSLQPDKLWQLLKQYPYFQAARLMLARQLHDSGHEAFPLSLKLAAAYASDRKMLRDLIENKIADKTVVEVNPVQELSNIVSDQFSENTDTEMITDTNKLPVEPKSDTFNEKQLETIQLIKTRLQNIQLFDETEDSENKVTVSIETKSFDDIIEKFIQNNPRINTPRRDFFNPVDVAKQSSLEPEDVVTETLAWVYEKQGLNEKAIKIYEKLMLLFPEKSTYFAARIKNLDESRK